MRPAHRFARLVITAALGGFVVGCDLPDQTLSPAALPAGPQLAASPTATFAVTQGYRKAVTAEGIRTHLAAFNSIAEQNGGVRASFDATHTATAEYVRSHMAAAGLNVTVQSFQFEYGGDLTPPSFSRVSPNPKTYAHVVEFFTMTYSGTGTVTGNVVPIGLEIPSIGGNTSGCEASDFAGFPAGAIALVQRSTCSFREKAVNAANAGAAGVIIMNEGNDPGRQGTVFGTLQAPNVSIPVIGTSFAVGVELAAMSQPVVRIQVNAATGTATSSNVIAETPDGDAENVVVVGAALDGRFGPAINATSGAATLLELARVYAAQERTPRNRVRFVWFGASPEGLFGATYYVNQLSSEQQGKIRAMIEIGPVGSPNFARFVLDGDQSEFSFPAPPNPSSDPGSATIEALFNDYFTASELAVQSSNALFSAREFRLAGVPVGALHSGSDDLKTAEQAVLFGGTPGVAFDPCFLVVCDGLANVSNTALDQMSDAAAHIVLTLSRRNFAQQPLVQN